LYRLLSVLDRGGKLRLIGAHGGGRIEAHNVAM
jgi:hypothetical protein